MFPSLPLISSSEDLSEPVLNAEQKIMQCISDTLNDTLNSFCSIKYSFPGYGNDPKRKVLVSSVSVQTTDGNWERKELFASWIIVIIICVSAVVLSTVAVYIGKKVCI